MDFTKLRNPQIRLWAEENFEHAPRLVDLGKPVVADVDKIVTSTNMKVGSYTIAAQPDVPRNITVTHTAVGAADTLGTIKITGTDVNGQIISETLTVESGDIATGRKAFKTVTSVVGAGWVIGEGNDTITVGVGSALGLPFVITEATQVAFTIVGTSITTPTVDHDDTDITECTVSTGTYDGSKRVFAVCLL